MQACARWAVRPCFASWPLRNWSASTILAAVLPHEGMLPVDRLSFRLLLYLFNSMVEGCGHVVEGCGGGQRRPCSGALSIAAAGAPQAHRPHVHSLPGAKFFRDCFTLRPA